MASYVELFPKDQDDLLIQVAEKFKCVTFTSLLLLTLFNSGMGSGKSNVMASLPLILQNFRGIVFVLQKNMHLKTQILQAFKGSISGRKMMLIDPDKDNVGASIRNALDLGVIPVVFLKNVAHSSGSLNKSAKELQKLIIAFPQHDKIALIDEPDNQLTSLTGGINAKLDHPAGIMEEYSRVAEQKTSLNIFDILRNNNVKAIGFSGTMNNMVCSKLPSLGYNAKDIMIVNVFPIAELYRDLKIISIEVNDFTRIGPYLIQAEAMPDKKILIAVPDLKSITEFKKNYANHFGRQLLSSAQITGSNEKERSTPEWKERFKNAKVVFGINIITVGFDLATWIKGQQFWLGILYRKLSDKISQPLSKNEEHVLHMDTAASLMQLLARLRDGGIFLVPSNLDGRPLYDRLVEVFDRIKRGLDEYTWVGGVSGTIQEERHHKSLVIALIQNLKDNNRPIVDGILTNLKRLTDRDFEEEMKVNLENPSLFDHPFWTGWIGCLWKTYQVDHDALLSDEEKEVKKVVIISTHKHGGVITTSGGVRNARLIDEKSKHAILERSQNTCGHCGEKFEDTDVPQDCHIRRNDDKGKYEPDNIIRGHSGCDSLYDDDGLIIYSYSGTGVFLRRGAKGNVPHKNQLAYISLENFKARWVWEKNRQGQSHLSDEQFTEHLIAKGYVFKTY